MPCSTTHTRHLMHSQEQQNSLEWLTVVAFGKHIFMSVKYFFFFFSCNSRESAADDPFHERKILCNALQIQSDITICSLTRCLNIILTLNSHKRCEWHMPHHTPHTWHRKIPKRWIAATEVVLQVEHNRKIMWKIRRKHFHNYYYWRYFQLFYFHYYFITVNCGCVWRCIRIHLRHITTALQLCI